MKIEFEAVIHLLHASRHGSLATQSVHLPGYPLPTILPYVLDERHRPVFLVSRLAEHTKNLAADSRAGFLVHAPDAQQLLTSERVSLLGDVAPCDAPPELVARYLRYQPDAAQYLALGDFAFFRLQPKGARYIAGFGKMGWVEETAWRDGEILSSADETKLVERLIGIQPAGIDLLGIDRYGVDVARDGKRERQRFAGALPELDRIADRVKQLLSAIKTDNA